MEPGISLQGMERLGDAETQIGILDERTKSMGDWMGKIETKVDGLFSKIFYLIIGSMAINVGAVFLIIRAVTNN